MRTQESTIDPYFYKSIGKKLTFTGVLKDVYSTPRANKKIHHLVFRKVYEVNKQILFREHVHIRTNLEVYKHITGRKGGEIGDLFQFSGELYSYTSKPKPGQYFLKENIGIQNIQNVKLLKKGTSVRIKLKTLRAVQTYGYTYLGIYPISTYEQYKRYAEHNTMYYMRDDNSELEIEKELTKKEFYTATQDCFIGFDISEQLYSALKKEYPHKDRGFESFLNDLYNIETLKPFEGMYLSSLPISPIDEK